MNASGMRRCIAPAILLAAMGIAGSEARAQGHVLLFSPALDAKLADAPFHRHAAERLADRLVRAGIPPQLVIRLSGAEATTERFQEKLTELVNSAAPDELLLVVLCSPGIQIEDVDYVCAANTPVDAAAEAGKSEARLISIRAVAESMAQSASRKQLLIVDAAGVREGPLADAAARFGRLPLRTADNQWIILNRGRHVTARGRQPAMTDFMWSLLDGLVYHADGNRDGTISLFELTEYMKLYSEDSQDTEPRIAGMIGDEVTLLPASADKDEAFPQKELLANAQRLVAEAQKSLLFDVDVYAALTLLDRANRLCRDEGLRGMIVDVLATARILNGEAAQILPDAAVEGKTWTAVLPRACPFYEGGGRTATHTLPAGTIVELTHEPSRYAWVTSAATARWTDRGLQLESFEIKPGDIETSLLRAESSQRVPNEYLRQKFLKITAPPQE